MTCRLLIPKQPIEGIVSIDIEPERILDIGDTDISGSIQSEEKFNVYVRIEIFMDMKQKKKNNSTSFFKVPKPILIPDFGPVSGGTKIRIQNLAFDNNLDLYSTMKIYLGKSQCYITKYAYFDIMIELFTQKKIFYYD